MNKRIRFNYADRKLNLSHKEHTKRVIELLFKKERLSLESLNYVFCSDDYLLKINQSFLKHNYFTDIITFDLSEPEQKSVQGEIYISIDRIKDNAQKLKNTFQDEALRVIFHGALHLCGHKDKSKEQQMTMRKLEDKYIKLWNKGFT